jgi:hypothetical protein
MGRHYRNCTSRWCGVACLPEKWNKAQSLIDSLIRQLDEHAQVAFKPLEQMRGFFVHLQRTYPVITPFLKGMHLTLDGWRPHRDEDFWPTGKDDWVDSSTFDSMESAPSHVTPAPRLREDMRCLQTLFSPEKPPIRLIRAKQRRVIIYGFVDASNSGFGGSFQLPDGAVFYRHGIWGRDADAATSNFWELSNCEDNLDPQLDQGNEEVIRVALLTFDLKR